MSRLAGILLAASLALGVAAAALWREAAAAREGNQQLMVRVDSLESTRGGQAAAPAPSPAGTAVSPGEADPVPATPTMPAQGAAARGNRSIGAGMREAMNTPEGREFTRSMMRMSLEEQYPDLAGELGITQEQAQRLLDLLARQRTDMGSDRLSLSTGGAPDPAAAEQRYRELAEKEQAYQAEVSQLLGASFAKWKDYERASATRLQEMYARQGREQLRDVINSRSNPLGTAQFDAFAAAVDAEQKRIDQESMPQSLQQHLQRQPEYNRRLLDVAARHLDGVQLERYRRHLEQEAEMMRTMMDAGIAGP